MSELKVVFLGTSSGKPTLARNVASVAVLLDGALVQSCLVPALHAQGASLRTIEGVARGGELDRVQRAMLEHGWAQCGMCTPGMIMAAHALLARHPHPAEAELQEGLAGNLCRCTGYTKIFDSVAAAAELLRAHQGERP